MVNTNTEVKGGEEQMGVVISQTERRIIVPEKYCCKKCDHSWVPRNELYPRVCPRCKSAWWDIPPSNKENEKQ
jgi:predicted Zn-ribbon and HTH transcriptional regulator